VISLLLATGLAAGEVPNKLGLVAEPAEVVAAYTAAVAARGRKGLAAQLDCRPAFDGLLLCLTLVEDGGWRYATAADLEVWGLDSEQAHRQAAERLRRLPLTGHLAAQAIEGVDGQYHAARLDDGQDAFPLLVPEALAQFLGGSPVVAVPAQGAFIAWVPGKPQLDKVVAVGIRRMHDGAKHPVSPRIYRWSEDGWEVWGEAKKPEPEPEPEP
jgi:hypothetical protein